MNTAYEIRGPALPCNCCHCAKFTYSPTMVHISGVGSAYTYLCKACALAMAGCLREIVEKAGDSPVEAQDEGEGMLAKIASSTCSEAPSVSDFQGAEPPAGWGIIGAKGPSWTERYEAEEAKVHTKVHRR